MALLEVNLETHLQVLEKINLDYFKVLKLKKEDLF